MLLLLGQPSAAVEEYQRLLDAALEHPYFLSDADKSAVEQRLQEARRCGRGLTETRPLV
jgi:hypothetical protein